MKSAREYAIAHNDIKDGYAFTALLFDHIKRNTEKWCRTGSNTILEDFKLLLDSPAYAPLKTHTEFAKLIKQTSVN